MSKIEGLPELPDPGGYHDILGRRHPCAFNAEDMHAYARAAIADAVAADRERCAVLCETSQVQTSLKGGGKFLAPFDAECGAMHEGMTYAAAIRAGEKT